jgi:hypothetical protein
LARRWGSGEADRAGSARDEASEASAVAGDDAVRAIEQPRRDVLENARERSRDPHRAKELDHATAVPDEPSVDERQAPARVPLRLRKHGEQVARVHLAEAEVRQLLVAVEPGDDPRRPAAEASLLVVQENRAGE